MITSILREQAREAEANIEFDMAAKLYRQAIKFYPTTGALAELDISNLTRKAVACESMVSA